MDHSNSEGNLVLCWKKPVEAPTDGCEEGWIKHVTGDQEFCVKNIGTVEGNVAQSECQKSDADLPLPETEQQNGDLKLLLNNMKVGEVWLGISDAGSEGSEGTWYTQKSSVIIGEASSNGDDTINWFPRGTGVAWA